MFFTRMFCFPLYTPSSAQGFVYIMLQKTEFDRFNRASEWLVNGFSAKSLVSVSFVMETTFVEIIFSLTINLAMIIFANLIYTCL